jgi:T6SS, Phospholipase effector Tle1-like, catalytic domain
MALYAFDGTCNELHEAEENILKNTNVVRFLHYYGENKTATTTLGLLEPDPNEEYTDGVGAELGLPGKIFGGFGGAGGRRRVKELVECFRENWAKGDQDVDVIGFSRGAALAIHFCHALAKGVDVGEEIVTPRVRFLNIWDTVTSFGLPGVIIDFCHGLNIGWNLSLPPNVDACRHALALDEHRQAFQVHRLDAEHNHPDIVQEIWFKGVHTDVGGGNGSSNLCNIALHWMLEEAAKCDLPIQTEKLSALGADCDRTATPFPNKWTGDWERREVQPGDTYHDSTGTVLPVDGTEKVAVHSEKLFNVSNIRVEKGARYTFKPAPDGRWLDKTIDCDATGWPDDIIQNGGAFGEIKERFLESFFVSFAKRVRAANWFEMVACIEYDDDNAIPIGAGQFADKNNAWVAPESGRLSFFANDHKGKYDNNSGSIEVEVTRIS